MDIQFNNASMVGTRSDRLNHIIIELPETDRRISEQAKKVFPGYAKVCAEKDDKLVKDIKDLTQKKFEIENSWLHWLGQRKHLVTWGSFGASGVIGTSVGVTMMVYRLVLPGVIFWGILGVNAGLSLSVYRCQLEAVQAKLRRTTRNLEISQKEKQMLDAIMALTNQIADFSSMWEAFEKDPNLAKAKPLFAMLQQIQNSYNIMHDEAMKLLSIHDFNSYEKWQKAFNLIGDVDVPLFKATDYLILIENVCKHLKSGPIVQAWKTLKSTPIQDSVNLPANIEPWTSMGMEDPASMDKYLQFFELVTDHKKWVYAETLQRGFMRALTQYFESENT